MTFRNKTTIIVAIVCLALTFLLTFMTANREYNQKLQQLQQFASSKIENRATLQLAIYHRDRPYLDVALEEFFALPTVNAVALYTTNGTHLAGRYSDKQSSGELPSLPLVRGQAGAADKTLLSPDAGLFTALTGTIQPVHLTIPVETTLNHDRSGLSGPDFMAAAKEAPKLKSRLVMGYLYLGIDSGVLSKEVRPAVVQVFAACLAVTLLCLAAIYLISRKISAPLTNLRQMAADIASGRPVTDLSIHEGGEFDDMANVVNNIIQAVQTEKQEVETDRKRLNMKVDESTSKLSQQDDQLSKAAEEINAAKSELHKMAYYDGLTNLPNRSLFQEQLKLLLNTNQRDSKSLALLFLNLNNFRRINDSFGYSVGDLVLTEISKRVSQCLRTGDVVAHNSEAGPRVDLSRLGGDEFAIVLNNVARPEAAGEVAQRILQEIAAPVNAVGQEIVVSASLGIAMAPQDAEDVEGLTKAAGIAMNTVEASPKGNFLFYRDDLNPEDQERFRMESELRKAIELQQIELYYQPQVDSADGAILCAEVLLRWHHPKFGEVPAGRFIPVAKKIGMLRDLGLWTTKEACRQLQALREQGLELPRVALNVSADELGASFTENLQQALAQTGIDGRSLELGLSEIVLMDEDSERYKCLQDLSRLGVHLSLDNFGISSTPLSHLKLYPLNELKIDRNIVNNCDSNSRNASLVKTIIAVAASLDMRVVAEGVETAEEFGYLVDCEVRAVQGFLFSKPIPVSELKQQLEVPWYFMSQIQQIKLAEEREI